MAFSYKDYIESELVKKRRNELDQHNANKIADWTGGTFGSQMKDALDKIQNRQKFQYDLNGDMLYQQYKDQYMRQGKLAMQDTMGQAAALTGGYGNSYANTVGNQAYQGYLAGLNDKVPQLYQMALDQYNQEGQNLKDNYALLGDAYNREYGEYQDRQNKWAADRDYLANAYNSERDYDRNAYTDNRNFSFNNYQQGVSERQWAEQMAEDRRRRDEDLAHQREREAIEDARWQKEYNLSLASRSSGGGRGGSGGRGSSSGGKSPTGKMLDEALALYNKGGDKALAQYIDKYPSYDGDYIMDYVFKYGTEKPSRAAAMASAAAHSSRSRKDNRQNTANGYKEWSKKDGKWKNYDSKGRFTGYSKY